MRLNVLWACFSVHGRILYFRCGGKLGLLPFSLSLIFASFFVVVNTSFFVVYSQIPLAEVYNDARRNVVVAMIMATNQEIPEVCVFFANRLLRANRTVKVDRYGAREVVRCTVVANHGSTVLTVRTMADRILHYYYDAACCCQ